MESSGRIFVVFSFFIFIKLAYNQSKFEPHCNKFIPFRDDKNFSSLLFSPESCYCTKGTYGCWKNECSHKFRTMTTFTICYMRIVGSLKSTSPVNITYGCDPIEYHPNFELRRYVAVYPDGRVIVSLECSKTNCNEFPDNCFKHAVYGGNELTTNNMKRLMDEQFYCHCSRSGMQPGYRRGCNVEGWCSVSLVNQVNNLSVNNPIYCANWGNGELGCYVEDYNQTKCDNRFYFMDVLIKVGDKKKRHKFCFGTNCQTNLSLTDFINCPDESDSILFHPSKRAQNLLVSKGKKSSRKTANIFGAVGAVVVIFVTIIVGIVVTFNAIRIIRIESQINSGKKSVYVRKTRKGIMDVFAV